VYFLKPIILGLFIGIVGVCINLTSLGPELEENFGLDLLFRLRGVRQAPPDVLVVSIDQESANALKLPDDPRKWPRSLHARLVEKLSSEGASVIAFDVIFTEKHSIRDDNAFAAALKRAGNTVLCECMKVENVLLGEDKGQQRGELNITKVIAPVDPFSQSALATAPFPIPKVSNKVSQYWMFTTVAGDKPTLPVASFQVFTMQVYDEFLQLLKKADPDQSDTLPHDKNAIINTRGIEKLIRDIRHIFQRKPEIAEKMLEELQKSRTSSTDQKKYQIIRSLIKMYQKNSNSQYINFYGPARTIPTVPYYQILNLKEKSSEHRQQFDIKGKAVFIGLSQFSPVDQKESFYTVYSESRGLDLSGIEIVATAFANMVEDLPVQPVNFRVYLIIIFFWGIGLGIICKRLSTTATFYSIIGLITVYMILAVFQFKHYGVWYPVITTIFVQPVLAIFAGLGWNYIEVKHERQNIRKALGFYLPDNIADQLSKNIENIHSSHQIVFGICLSTDAEQYSSLAETMDPKELGSFMNRYYETIFKPIKQHGGIVSDVIGDSVLAIWISAYPESVLKQKACTAALEILREIQKFNRESVNFKLPTRIGLHSGHILMGNIGAIDHYEYRPVGDIVNTATRIEGLNKYLKTQILVTKEVINNLDGFLTREIGEFKLAGKSKPVIIYELVCRLEEANERQRRAYVVFTVALELFRKRSWDEAIEEFHEAIDILGSDGPSDFYIKLCRHNKELIPGELWDGVIHMEKK
jgi:adenylate cyclase